MKQKKEVIQTTEDFSDKDPEKEFSHIWGSIIAVNAAVGFMKDSLRRGRYITDEELNDEKLLDKFRKENLELKAQYFAFAVEIGVTNYLECKIKNFVYPYTINENKIEIESIKSLMDAIESEKRRQRWIEQTKEIIERNLNNPRNKAILADGYYKDIATARIAFDEANLKGEFLTKSLYEEESEKLKEIKQLLEFGLKFSRERQKTLENEIARRKEEEPNKVALIPEARKLVKRAEKDVETLIKLDEKAGRLLQNGTVTAEVHEKFTKVLSDFNDCAARHAQISNELAKLGNLKLAPMPALPKFSHKGDLMKKPLSIIKVK